MSGSSRVKVIVAVSGGIDSVVLLKKLVHDERYDIIVAHVDHGIRDDSHKDAELVRALAQEYRLPYEETRLDLGKSASEEVAREKRYEWLFEIKDRYGADAIATAHHQDDVIETMIINLIRGTGWRGLCALVEQDDIMRPLLLLSKAEIVRYAIDHDLEWREDSTNEDVRYLRNFVRFRYMQRMSPEQRAQWIELYTRQSNLKLQIDRNMEEVIPMMRAGEGYSGIS